MKSLYSILGLSATASQQQIEAAYTIALSECQTDNHGAGEEHRKIRLVAIKEAYSVLSNPARRTEYDQKLSGIAERNTYPEPIQEGGFGEFKKIIVILIILLCGGAYYLHHSREQERMKMEHARAIADKALRIAEEEQKQKANMDSLHFERMQRLDEEAKERQRLAEIEKFKREVDSNNREIDSAASRAAYMEQRKALDEKREREMQERRQQAEAQEGLRRDKAELQRMERENYGRVITR